MSERDLIHGFHPEVGSNTACGMYAVPGETVRDTDDANFTCVGCITAYACRRKRELGSATCDDLSLDDVATPKLSIKAKWIAYPPTVLAGAEAVAALRAFGDSVSAAFPEGLSEGPLDPAIDNDIDDQPRLDTDLRCIGGCEETHKGESHAEYIRRCDNDDAYEGNLAQPRDRRYCDIFTLRGPNFVVQPGYLSLFNVLRRALDHASIGKGHQRHGSAAPFERQRTQQIADMLDTHDGMLHQAIKKIGESKVLATPEQQVAELLGAINYLAGAIIRIERKEKAK